jgi:hypothetical protein
LPLPLLPNGLLALGCQACLLPCPFSAWVCLSEYRHPCDNRWVLSLPTARPTAPTPRNPHTSRACAHGSRARRHILLGAQPQKVLSAAQAGGPNHWGWPGRLAYPHAPPFFTLPQRPSRLQRPPAPALRPSNAPHSQRARPPCGPPRRPACGVLLGLAPHTHPPPPMCCDRRPNPRARPVMPAPPPNSIPPAVAPTASNPARHTAHLAICED